MAGRAVTIEFIGDTSKLSSASTRAEADLMKVEAAAGKSSVGLSKAGTDAEKAGAATKAAAGDMESGMSAMGMAATAATGGVLALVAAIGSVVAIGVVGAGKFKDLGLEVSGLMRVTGASAEEMSRLDFAAKDSAVSAESLGKAYKFLSKDLASDMTPGALAVHGLGVATKDAHGQMRSMNDIIEDLADKFSKMDDGARKDALSMQIFGKSGMDMIPMLNKGKAGLDDLEASADKFGQTLDAEGVQKARDAAKAQRELGFAWDGLQITLGQYVLPVLTKVAEWLTDKIQPAIEYVKVGVFMLQGAWERITNAFNAGGLGAAMDEFGNIMSSLWTVIQPAVTELINHLKIAAGELWTNAIQPALSDMLDHLKDWAISHLPDVAMFIGSLIWKNFTEWTPHLVSSAILALGDLLGKIGEWFTGTAWPWISQHFAQFKDAAIDWIENAAREAPGKLAHLAGEIVGWITQQALEMPGRLHALADNMIGWIEDAAKAAPGKLIEFAGKIQEFLNGLPGQIVGWIGDAAHWLYDIGGDVIRGLMDGIKNILPSIIAQFINIKDQFVQGFKDAFHISSPSQIMADEIGAHIAGGVGMGITDNWGSLVNGPLAGLASGTAGALGSGPGLHAPGPAPGGLSAAPGGAAMVHTEIHIDGQSFLTAITPAMQTSEYAYR